MDGTGAIAAQFEQLFDLQLLPEHLKVLHLTVVQTLLCFRSELICLLFLLTFLLQSAVIGISSHFRRIYARRRRGSFVLRKRSGFYTVESGIFSTFQVKKNGRPSLSADPEDDVSFLISPSRFPPVKRIITLLLAACFFAELFFAIPPSFLTYEEMGHFLGSQLISFFPFLSITLRLVVLLIIFYHLYRQTQPAEKIVFLGDSLSPSVHSRFSQALISIFWFASLLNTALNIHQMSVRFTVSQSVNDTLAISSVQICNACQWQTHLPSSSYSRAFTDNSPFYSKFFIATFYLNWIYFFVFLCQFVLAFAPDFDVKLHSKHGSADTKPLNQAKVN